MESIFQAKSRQTAWAQGIYLNVSSPNISMWRYTYTTYLSFQTHNIVILNRVCITYHYIVINLIATLYCPKVFISRYICHRVPLAFTVSVRADIVFSSDGTVDTGAPMLRRSFQSTTVSHTVPMLVSKWQYHVIDDVWSFKRHAVSENRDSWFETFGASPDT